MSQTISYIHPESLIFPDVSTALSDPNGLLAVGGDLSTERLVKAYSLGIFPWYSEGEPLMWWSPNPRAIIPIDELRINRTLRKFINKQPYQVTLNQAFDEVISLCSDAPFRKEDTWITDEMYEAYCQLHQAGHAHSIEVWCEEELVGGLYGVAIGGYFSGESMFYAKPNASKIALAALAKHLTNIGSKFIDCQLTNHFLEDMGCVEISRNTFISKKDDMMSNIVDDEFWQPKSLSY